MKLRPLAASVFVLSAAAVAALLFNSSKSPPFGQRQEEPSANTSSAAIPAAAVPAPQPSIAATREKTPQKPKQPVSSDRSELWNRFKEKFGSGLEPAFDSHGVLASIKSA